MNQARDLSFLVKDIDPDIVTIAGGAHPSALPQESLEESALDLVACGEGDDVVAHLLDGRRQDVFLAAVASRHGWRMSRQRGARGQWKLGTVHFAVG